ncbi:hypothetical protein BUALT_Bualt11G0112400 [Buddleja alternifolia]|uniref:Uncharacterized protein n=1 Tax=Buddleja alternifolia TaxID=168488 RepID=A0AAV6WYZ6_9LAMI|nr:hypothetical protein BUALT_Bualt11G0112400 [Buddleja alternifolia]
MNILVRTKIPLLLHRKRSFLPYPITALQQCNFYSAKTPYNTPKTQQFAKPRTQKSSESSTSVPQRIKEQSERVIVWPRPREIPYQAKVANFVNLIGYVKSPVRFEADSDGKPFAATVISQSSGEKNSVLIPVVFEGDLANVVACHVKEKDCVFVSGQLSSDPLRFMFSESLGKFHVVAENLNFVEGFKRSVVSSKKMEVSFLDVEINKPGGRKTEEVVNAVDNDVGFNQQWKEALELAKGKSLSGVKNEWVSGVSAENSVIPLLNVEGEAKTLVHDELKAEQSSEKSGSKKRNGDVIHDLWRNLVKNPLQWWDYRDHKAKGLVKEKYPDFKQKETGESLWINTAPNWVLPGFEKLEFDVMAVNAKQARGGEKRDSKGEDLWKNLVENPNRWWDNRLDKRNPRAPDFKHKETGEGLWMSDIPDWALSRLPPSKDGQTTA